MKLERVRYWIALLSRYIVGQGFVTALNLAAGILILRILPVKEYGLYIIANVFLGAGNIGSDLGLSKGIITMGTKLQSDRAGLGRLFVTGLFERRQLFVLAAVIASVLYPVMVRDKGWSFNEAGVCLVIVLVSVWFQQQISMCSSILSIHHDEKSFLKSGLAYAAFRVVSVLVVLRAVPFAAVALGCNLLAYILEARIIRALAQKYFSETSERDPGLRSKLRTFAIPLMPRNIFGFFQGQVPILMLSLFGNVQMIAQYGALGRLGQILMVISGVNPFFVQPYFARIHVKRIFINRLILLVCILLCVTGVAVMSTLIWPHPWLFVLGRNYWGLTAELPVVIYATFIGLLQGVLFTILLSRSETRGQMVYVLLHLSADIGFFVLFGVDSTLKAYLMVATALTLTTLLHVYYMTRMIRRWKK